MRVIVFFDLPTETSTQRKEYTKFHKFLIRSGFIMIQKSVYAKLAINTTSANAVNMYIKHNKPSQGVVQMLTITENQFQKMEYVVGEKTSNVVDSIERMVEL